MYRQVEFNGLWGDNPLRMRKRKQKDGWWLLGFELRRPFGCLTQARRGRDRGWSLHFHQLSERESRIIFARASGRRVLKVKCFRLEFSSRMRISHRTFDLVCSHPLTLLHLLLIKSGNELYLSNDLTNMMSKRFYKARSSLPSFLHFLPAFLSLTLHVCARCAPSFPPYPLSVMSCVHDNDPTPFLSAK